MAAKTAAKAMAAGAKTVLGAPATQLDVALLYFSIAGVCFLVAAVATKQDKYAIQIAGTFRWFQGELGRTNEKVYALELELAKLKGAKAA